MIKLKANHYSGGTAYVPVSREDELLMQHCMGTDLISINHHGLEQVKIVAAAHGWDVVIV